MLNARDNELLTQTGPGTPMGALLREYWWPVMRSDRLVADGEPVRVRLLSEDYVAFRDTEGRLGFLDEYCPHRRVSLVLARNEDCGLRCLMHGWKIDVNGKVIETPNEVEAGARLDRIKVRSFPIREAANMVFVYVGDKEAPPFPNLRHLSAYRAEPLIAEVECNWIQVMETLWDPAHVGILHTQGTTFKNAYKGTDREYTTLPRASYAVSGIQTRDEDFGFSFRAGADRAQAGDESSLMGWVPTIMPCWIHVGGGPPRVDADQITFAHTPVDDTHMLLWEIPYNLVQDFGDFGRVNATAAGDAFHNFRLPDMHRENNWAQDREAMKNGSWTGVGRDAGIRGIFCHDIAVAESMGPITDRSFENLGPADHALIRGRQVFLEAMRAHQAGKGALGLHADLSRIGPQPAAAESVAAE